MFDNSETIACMITDELKEFNKYFDSVLHSCKSDISPFNDGNITPKAVWLAQGFRQCIIFRFQAIYKPMLACIGDNNRLALMILLRQGLETVAFGYSYVLLCENFLNNPQIENFPNFYNSINQYCFGQRKNDWPIKAINILNHIDALDKLAPGYRFIYDELSEAVHPNWLGLTGGFSEIDYENIMFKFYPRFRNHSDDLIKSGISGLIIFKIVLSRLDESILKLENIAP